ncbi:hypothetical protein RND81_13G159500 [Saponaria officinalis]|uniref:Uncharacterized protein n=1 Tax=Saponaria officinalis TaxID=3572 RepID=A0AAW1H347_SAPOF
MADDLADGEFWLPSQFLTDDDILMDFKSDASGSGFGFGSDIGSLTTETETSSDDDDHLLVLPRKVIGSPQSTLCGWDHGSPTGPVSPEKEPLKAEVEDKNATLDLLNKAAGEVAKMKLRTEKSTGTGFFDCSNSAKGLFSPSQPPPPPPPVYPPHFYAHPHFRRFPPHLMWIPPPQQPQVQNRVTKNTTNNKNGGNNNRPLGLPPSAWPPLPGQAQAQQQTPPKTQAQAQSPQPQAQPMMRMYVGPQNVSVGTGVFLPRRVTAAAAAEPKKKSDGNATKSKNNKASQRRNSRPAKVNDEIEIQLPSEWVY